MIITLLIFVFAMVILFDPTIRNGLGEIVGYALDPTLGALGQNDPVPALFLTGMLMIAPTTLNKPKHRKSPMPLTKNCGLPIRKTTSTKSRK